MGQINIIETKLPGVLIVEPKVHGDHRGWFYEAYAKRDYVAAGLDYDFVQDNRSFSSARGTFRGIHFQRGEASQAKLVWCSKGAVVDIAVDLRCGSPNYLRWDAVELSEENKRQFMIPRGFGHAFLSLTDNVEFCYKADNYYNYEADGGIRFDDPDIGIDLSEWGFERSADGSCSGLILSDKDKTASFARDADTGYNMNI